MSTDTLLKTTPDKPSVAGDGVTVTLSDGKAHELRFSVKAIIRVENVYGTHEDFLLALESTPLGTLASLLILASDATTEEQAIDLLDGVNWRDLRKDVDRAWRKANWEPEAPSAVPTTGQ